MNWQNFIFILDTMLVKYCVYNKMYTKTSMVSTDVDKNLYLRLLVKNREKYCGSQPINNNIL